MDTPYKHYKLSFVHYSPEVEDAYFKCKKVIKSCMKLEQLKVAASYVNLWKKKYPDVRVFHNKLDDLLYKQELDIIYLIKLRNRNAKRRILPN